MKRKIARNIAVISAIFIVTFSIMLVTNYFQVKDVNPLQTEMVETLKEINDANANNPALQEQIRQLDLLARRAYFIRMDHLMTGVYLLMGMLILFIVTLRYYYAETKHIPDKEIDPIDEWAIKTQARKYIRWGAAGMATLALLFVALSSPYLSSQQEEEIPQDEMVAYVEDIVESGEYIQPEDNTPEAETPAEAIAADIPGETPAEAAPETQPETPRITHNGFRGNTSNGISAARSIPVTWNLHAGENIAWRTEIPRRGYNSPVIHGNCIYFSGADEQVRELYCYDLHTGKQLWSLAATHIPGSPAQLPKTTEDTGLAASTVVTNGKQVCAIFATGDLLCADTDGKQLWAKNLGVPDNHYGYASSLLIHGNLLIIQYDNANSSKVLALDIATGAERWSRSRTEKVTWSSPIIAHVNNQSQLVLMGNPAITAYNPSNGEQLWRVECLTGEVGASACSAAGIIYGASEYSKLVAINGTDGSVLWESDEFLPEVASPVATKDHVYIATSYGIVAAFDSQSGEMTTYRELNAEFYSSPMLVEGKIYLFSNDGKMHIFSANGDLPLLSSFETGERTFATPAFTDGKMVVRTEQSIYCVAAN
ncbi:MAG: PQQ-binding-like beta-propeller repeat protein [Tannerellaceae bacterium]|nr:PQQ-binding-like beta-propeller repeat protein [Tannerellaceae bacterium]